LIAQAIIWLMTSHPEHTVRRATRDETARLAAADAAKLGFFMRQALKQWVLDVEHQTKDSVAAQATNSENYRKDIAPYRLATVLNAITSFSNDLDSSIKNSELIQLLILAHHKYIASPTNKYNWITLVQRVNVDPGRLISEQSTHIVELLQNALTNRNEVRLNINFYGFLF
jgi:hypothetical protein